VEGALLLDVVVGERAPVLELLPRKNQTLLVGRNPYEEKKRAKKGRIK